MNDKDLKFDEITNIDSILSVLGLIFPSNITEFQKAALTLAHLMASLRDYVLKQEVVPTRMVDLVNMLAIIMDNNLNSQTQKDGE